MAIFCRAMRTQFTKVLTDAEGGDLLTTGEAARLLGTSRQHVVDLCNSGSLPHVTVGRHRRVTRQDVEALRTGTSRLTRDQLRSLWLSHAVAARLAEDPVGVLTQARANLKRMLESSARGSARVWLEQWDALLKGPVEAVLAALTSRSPRSRELRQNTPFAGVLSEEQRKAVLRGFTLAHHEAAVP
jgi:excisionase family DNA binding protein